MIIGITGRKQSGKDTFYNVALERIGNVKRVAFADPVKQELAEALGVIPEEIEFNKKRYRKALQLWGTEIRRELFGRDYWIKRARLIIGGLAYNDPNALIIVTDVRFPNEAEAVRDMGGVIVKVIRKRPFWTRVKSMFKREHASERLVDTITADYTIHNNGAECDYWRKVNESLEAIYAKAS